MYSHAEWQNGKVLPKVQHKRCNGGERMNKLEVIIPKGTMKQLTERITALKDEDNIIIRKLISKASIKVTADTTTYFILSTPLTREIFSGFYSVRRIK